ncbi:Ig domain-containing protein [Pseudanabaena sp. PCC 6802]|uniref:Ig domain-containing protein n=1 Tax=Pseudanabaena sp. PCC 6802 TaxID=118173 RepID=UPI000346F103|nr:Ig domain-containing protein [Pseudanabaena sp. PCC 6802]
MVDLDTEPIAIVISPMANRPPSITSTPLFPADTNRPYTYQVRATYPDVGDAIAYELIEKLLGIEILTTGLVNWATPITGNYRVEVGAKDSKGLGAAQSFSLTARLDLKPIIRSEAITVTATAALYAYDVQAVDPEGSQLSYGLDPAAVGRGMSIDAVGRLRWTPTAAQVGAYPVVVTVTDAVGNAAVQEYTLTVTADGIAPVVKLGFAGFNPTDVGTEVTFYVSATDNVGVTRRQLFVDGKGVILDNNGSATVRMSRVGVISIIAKAMDAAGNEGSDTLSVTVSDPTDIDAPEVAFELRQNGQVLAEDATIRPLANYWSLD